MPWRGRGARRRAARKDGEYNSPHFKGNASGNKNRRQRRWAVTIGPCYLSPSEDGARETLTAGKHPGDARSRTLPELPGWISQDSARIQDKDGKTRGGVARRTSSGVAMPQRYHPSGRTPHSSQLHAEAHTGRRARHHARQNEPSSSTSLTGRTATNGIPARHLSGLGAVGKNSTVGWNPARRVRSWMGPRRQEKSPAIRLRDRCARHLCLVARATPRDKSISHIPPDRQESY